MISPAPRLRGEGRAQGAPQSNDMPMVSATSAGRDAPSTSTVFSEVMRTPPSTGSTALIFWRSRMREPAGTCPVKRTRFEP